MERRKQASLVHNDYAKFLSEYEFIGISESWRGKIFPGKENST